jgi:hypothetical protein
VVHARPQLSRDPLGREEKRKKLPVGGRFFSSPVGALTFSSRGRVFALVTALGLGHERVRGGTVSGLGLRPRPLGPWGLGCRARAGSGQGLRPGSHLLHGLGCSFTGARAPLGARHAMNPNPVASGVEPRPRAGRSSARVSSFVAACPSTKRRSRVRGGMSRPNKRLQLTAAGGGVPGGQPSGGRSGGRLAAALRSVVRWCTRGCS